MSLSTELTELPQCPQNMAATFLKIKEKEGRREKGGAGKEGERRTRKTERRERRRRRTRRRGGGREKAQDESYRLLSPNLRRDTPSLLPHAAGHTYQPCVVGYR